MLGKSILFMAYLAAMSAMPGTAQAQSGAEPGWYVGAAAGRSDFDYDDLDFYAAGIEDEDFSDTAYSLYGGYRLARHFAIEAGYADLGEFEYTLGCAYDFVCVDGPRDHRLTADRWDLALMGILPFGQRFDAYAKLGIARTNYELSEKDGRLHESNTHGTYGLGLRMHLDAPWSLRLQWDRLQEIGELQGEEGNVDVLWLGAEYRFGG